MGEDGERAAVAEKIANEVRSCTRCRLHRGRTHAVPGEGPLDADVFLIGEAPGRAEDASGRPFVGAAGKILDRALSAAHLSRGDVFITNVVKCRPPANRAPKADEMGACQPYLRAQIDVVRPKVLVTLGNTALRGLLGPEPRFSAARGKSLVYGDIAVLPTYHPAAVLYNRRMETALRADLRKVARLVREGRPRFRGGRPRDGMPVRPARSAGAAVMNSNGRVLLLRKADEGMWCLPKGTLELGETSEQAAVREVREETGLRVRLIQPLTEIRYAFYWPPDGVNVDKTVTYFLARPTGGRVRPEPGFDVGRWVSRAEAMKRLHWPNDREVVRMAFETMRSRTVTGKRRESSPGTRRSTRRPR